MITELKTLPDFFLLKERLRDYLRYNYLEAIDCDYFVGNAVKAGAAMLDEWQKVHDSEPPEEEWSPEEATRDQIQDSLNVFNCVLAVLYRKDWGEYQSTLFGDWIPFGVEAFTDQDEEILVLKEPFFAGQSDTVIVDVEHDLEFRYGLYWDTENAPVLFWKRMHGTQLPLAKMHVNYFGGVEFNLWQDADITRLIPAILKAASQGTADDESTRP